VTFVDVCPQQGPLRLEASRFDSFLRSALEEDVGSGDVTTEGLLDGERRAEARLVAKAPGILAGIDVFRRVFELLDPDFEVVRALADGAALQPGAEVLVAHGRARALLTGERTALNLVQRLSGIATRTAAFVAAVGGRARVLDTRKTTPGLRLLEKHAVCCGGGENHRFGLFDQAMVKNNHVDLAGRDLAELVRELRGRHGAKLVITAEARDEAEARAAIAGGADVLLLDNFTPAALGELIPRLRQVSDTIELEASGGVTLENAAAFARAGVDRISVGGLTHSAPALDLSLRLAPWRPA
jgi:nicotinate-nucleotide pyrophosphorylase (carboxylating)